MLRDATKERPNSLSVCSFLAGFRSDFLDALASKEGIHELLHGLSVFRRELLYLRKPLKN